MTCVCKRAEALGARRGFARHPSCAPLFEVCRGLIEIGVLASKPSCARQIISQHGVRREHVALVHVMAAPNGSSINQLLARDSATSNIAEVNNLKLCREK